MTAIAKPRYYSPCVERTASVDVYLTDFTTDELQAELLHRLENSEEKNNFGSGTNSGDSLALLISDEDMSQLDTLLMCGLRESAQELVGRLVFNKLGRRL